MIPDQPAAVDPEYPPVDLDQPDVLPDAVKRWQVLADREHFIHHHGDAENIIPFPRPAWADPDCDLIRYSLGQTAYRSTNAWVQAKSSGGQEIGNGELEPASVRVRAIQYGTGEQVVSLYLSRTEKSGGKFLGWGVNLTPTEVGQLIEVLRAAVDLIGGAQ